MVVLVGTSEIHSETFARALGCGVTNKLTSEPVVFVCGMSPDTADLIRAYRNQGSKVVGYWIGTDSLAALQNEGYRRNIAECDLHLAVHERIQRELWKWRVKSEVVYPCARNPSGVLPLPGTKSVGIYAPTPIPNDLYMFNECLTVARENPQCRFVFFGSPKPLQGLPWNCVDWGRKDPDQSGSVYDEIDVLLRLCRHDGNPIGGIEAKMRGRHVIENYPYEHFICVDTLEDVNTVLQSNEVWKADEEGARWYQERCSSARFKTSVENLLRGTSGDQQAANVRTEGAVESSAVPPDETHKNGQAQAEKGD